MLGSDLSVSALLLITSAPTLMEALLSGACPLAQRSVPFSDWGTCWTQIKAALILRSSRLVRLQFLEAPGPPSGWWSAHSPLRSCFGRVLFLF